MPDSGRKGQSNSLGHGIRENILGILETWKVLALLEFYISAREDDYT